MIRVFIGHTEKEFQNVKSALRFMYSMRSKGYFITGWQCDDPEENEWLNRRFRQ